MAIKYRDSDAEKLRRTVKNFNAKISRAEARGYTALPERVAVRDLISDIGTRADFNRTVNMLQRFSKKGAERAVDMGEGFTVAAWERTEMNRQRAIINVKRARELERIKGLDVTSRGEPVGLKRGQMGDARVVAFKEKPPKLKFDSRAELEAYKRTLRKQTKSNYFSGLDEQYKRNYIKGLRSAFGGRANSLIAKIEALPARAVVEKMYTEQEGNIAFIYDELEAAEKLAVLNEVWDNVQTEQEYDEIEI
jgi:hypothetical protein